MNGILDIKPEVLHAEAVGKITVGHLSVKTGNSSLHAVPQKFRARMCKKEKPR